VEDLKIVREPIVNEDVTVALQHAESRVRDWSETVVLALSPPDHGLMMLPMSFFGRREKQDSRCRVRRLCGSCSWLWFWLPHGGGEFGCCYARQNVRSRDLFSAGRADPCIFFGYSMSEASADRGADGGRKFHRSDSDELGRLVNSLAVMQSSLEHGPKTIVPWW
jgi:hypothetical protein